MRLKTLFRALLGRHDCGISPDDLCPQYPHGVPLEFGLTSSVFNQVLSRFYSKRHRHPSFHYVSHDHTHLLTCLSLKQSYMGIVRFEVFVRRLRIRIVSQGLVCVHSDGLGSCLLFRVCFFTASRGYSIQ